MLSRLSVKRPYTVVVAVIMILILGGISFVNLKTDLLPNIDLPYALIMTSYPGASPEEVEMVVTRPVEQVLATVSNIKKVSSISRENSSIVILEFNNDVNMDSATIEINGMLDLIKPAWGDSIGSPMVMRLNPDMLPIMVASVDVEDMDIIEISQLASRSIIPEFESISGVASVSGVGLLEEKIQVLIDKDKIDGLNKRILETVDSELAKAEDKLSEAKKEIEEGRTKLKTEEDKQRDKLAQGEKVLAEAKKQISEGERQLDLGESELEKAEEGLKTKLSELEGKENQIQELLDLIQSMSQGPPQGDPGDLQENLLTLLESLPQEIIGGMSPELVELIEKAQGGGRLNLQEMQQLSVGVLEELQKNLGLIALAKTEIENGLKEIASNREKLVEERELISSKKNELSQKEQEIVQGKLLLTIEMDKARTQLEDGEETLKGKVAEFETSRDEAFKKASLDGVISRDMISGILAAQNFSMPAGSVSEEGTDYLVKVGDKFKDMDELRGLMLFDTGDKGIGKVYLKDVADITKVDNSKDIYAKVNGNNAVMLTFQKQSAFSTAEVTGSIRKKAEELAEKYEGLSVTALMDQGMYIDIVVDSVLSNVVYGGLLAILILLLFLKDLKPTFIIAVSIPISLIFAIAMMYFTGVTINIISLAGLALGVGMLVDNSIVVIENIYRLRHLGKTAGEAAVEGAKEIAGAIIASTLTTVCVFLPIVFIKGISRQIFMDMGLTIAYSLVASLIVALTLVPAMASAMLKKTAEKRTKVFDRFTEFYSKLLEWSLGHRAIVMALVVALMGLSVYLGLSMGTAFIPDMDAPQMSVSIEMPKEATFDDTISMSDRVMERLFDIEGIETIGAFQSGAMGGGLLGGSGGTGSNSMSLYLILDENKRISNAKIERQIKELTKDLDCEIRIHSSNMDMTALGGSGIEILVKGREIDTLQEISADIAKILREVEGTTEISYGAEETLTEIRIVVDKEKAMENGLTVAQVFSKVSPLLSQDKSATTLSFENRDYPVIVVDNKSENLTRQTLKDLTIKANKDGQEMEVAMEDIVEITEGKGLASIRRDSQERYLTVTAGISADHNIGLVSREFEGKLRDYVLPEGYKIEFSGESETINTSLRDLVYMLLLAIAFIYLIMVAQFQSLLSPFIVMFTIPLAFTGGLIALAITGYEISLISMLGFLVLSGVVVNNGIVFVDFANQLRERGHKKTEALILAGKTRIKPILMTAITTILGLSTLSLGVGMGSEMLQPLAIVSIGGLTYATILTLFVVPVMYHLFHKETARESYGKGDA